MTRSNEEHQVLMQEMSLKYINMEKLEWHTAERDGTTAGTSGIMEKLDKFLENSTSQPKFKCVYCSDDDLPLNCGYKLYAYRRTFSSRSSVSRLVEYLMTSPHASGDQQGGSQNENSGDEDKKNEYILFFYRKVDTKDEIFAAMTGHAWETLAKISDYKFPIFIAKRILDPESIIQIKTRSMAGSKSTVNEIFRHWLGFFQSKTVNNQYLILKGHLKSSNSLRGIVTHLSDSTSSSSESRTNSPIKFPEVFENCVVEIQQGAVHFCTSKISDKQYPYFLNHLSNIARGDKTYKYSLNDDKEPEDNEEKDDTRFACLEFIQPASSENQEHLLKHIYECLFSYYSSDSTEDMSGIHGIRIAHKHVDDFSLVSSVQLKYRYARESIEIPTPVAVSEVINDLKEYQIFDKFETDVFNAENKLQTFTNRLKKEGVSISWNKGKKVIDEPLHNYLEIEPIWLNDFCLTRIGNMCYEVSADFLRLVDKDFRSVLDKIHKFEAFKAHEKITSNSHYKWYDNFDLMKQQCDNSWQRKKNQSNEKQDKEGFFNLAHLGKEGYLFGDKVSSFRS
ncbi:unnamed protein product [Rotaria magnacalcarata]|uniref:Uncharacterized protein n=1 Tax=Rotaria magnacalcarata TaxID=392030 RepID=A0A816N685_9BILA|nr:unnamed protein product [Rotaria magnacalcarata]CAF2030639.1 unnamed protein product [Rotaria magnacalcarata]CAF3982365.1 unnamed protein product [Rotaria magnacalcarata]CAF4130421.1 unnamed protein product [Rotaria magnacalcarata]